MQPIHILKPGSFTDSAGQKVSFTEADLQAMAGVYDRALHEAPLVVGHPAHDAPAISTHRPKMPGIYVMLAF